MGGQSQMIEKKKHLLKKKVLTQSFPRKKQTNIQFEFDMIMILSSKNHQLYSQRFCDKSILTCTYENYMIPRNWRVGGGKKTFEKTTKTKSKSCLSFLENVI